MSAFHGRPPRGVRELKLTDYSIGGLDHCRTPHGVRELKLGTSSFGGCPFSSHPSQGVGVEIPASFPLREKRIGRIPHGVRELKCYGLDGYSRMGRKSHSTRVRELRLI